MYNKILIAFLCLAFKTHAGCGMSTLVDDYGDNQLQKANLIEKEPVLSKNKKKLEELYLTINDEYFDKDESFDEVEKVLCQTSINLNESYEDKLPLEWFSNNDRWNLLLWIHGARFTKDIDTSDFFIESEKTFSQYTKKRRLPKSFTKLFEEQNQHKLKEMHFLVLASLAMGEYHADPKQEDPSPLVSNDLKWKAFSRAIAMAVDTKRKVEGNYRGRKKLNQLKFKLALLENVISSLYYSNIKEPKDNNTRLLLMARLKEIELSRKIKL